MRVQVPPVGPLNEVNMKEVNKGLVEEYYDTVKQALKVDLKREPTHEEIMEIVNKLVKKWYV